MQPSPRRQEVVEVLYRLNGRDDPTHLDHGSYEGLWEPFALALADRLCSASYEEVLSLVIEAIHKTDSHLVEKHAAAAIAAIRSYLLVEWERQ